MTRPVYTPIIGTLGYVWDRSSDVVLMVLRNARPDDQSIGKWNGLGGKLEANEDVATGMMRELREEAAIVVTDMRLRATISWPGFGPNGEDWLGFVFVIEAWTGTVPPTNDEGELHWIPRRRLLDACSDVADVRAASALPMWSGDRFFVPPLFDDDPRCLHGIMPYANGAPTSWNFTRI